MQDNDNGVAKDIHCVKTVTVQDRTRVCIEEEYECGVGISIGTIFLDSQGRLIQPLTGGGGRVELCSHNFGHRNYGQTAAESITLYRGVVDGLSNGTRFTTILGTPIWGVAPKSAAFTF